MSALRFYGVLGRFTWRMLATVLAGQAVVIFFGALVGRALATAEGADHGSVVLWVGSGLALLAVVAAGLLRRPFGLTLGWLVQLATLASAYLLPMMAVVALIFGGLWVACLVQGDRIDRLQDRRAAEAG